MFVDHCDNTLYLTHQFAILLIPGLQMNVSTHLLFMARVYVHEYLHIQSIYI